MIRTGETLTIDSMGNLHSDTITCETVGHQRRTRRYLPQAFQALLMAL